MEDADHRATPLREVWEKLSEWCPGLSERAKRSSWGLKAVLLLLHVVFVGTVFVLDPTLVRRTREEPWYTAAYLVLLLVTLVQYMLTSVSSPGYVIDAMRAGNEMHATFINTSMISKEDNPLQKMEARPLSVVINWKDLIHGQIHHHGCSK